MFLTSLHCTFMLHTQRGCLNSRCAKHINVLAYVVNSIFVIVFFSYYPSFISILDIRQSRLGAGCSRTHGSIPERDKNIYFFPKISRRHLQPYPSSQSTSVGNCYPCISTGRLMKLTTRFHSMANLRINGAIPSLRAWGGVVVKVLRY